MKAALEQAESAARLGEVPVGAVVVKDGKIIAQAHNRRELAQDPMAHAEILALSRAAKILDSWRLCGCSLYVTLEPCPMCAGALVNARVDNLIYGCLDPKAGAVRSLYTVCDDPRLNHRLQVTGGVMAHECALRLSTFFKELRAKSVAAREGHSWVPKVDKPEPALAQAKKEPRPPEPKPESSEVRPASSRAAPGKIPMAPRRVPTPEPKVKPSLTPRQISGARPADPTVTVGFGDGQNLAPTLMVGASNSPGVTIGLGDPQNLVPTVIEEAPGPPPVTIGLGDLPGDLITLSDELPGPEAMSPVNPGVTMGIMHLPPAKPARRRGSGAPLEEDIEPEPMTPHVARKKGKKGSQARGPEGGDKTEGWGVDPTPTRDYPAASDAQLASRRPKKK